jgi:hypothetical protein
LSNGEHTGENTTPLLGLEVYTCSSCTLYAENGLKYLGDCCEEYKGTALAVGYTRQSLSSARRAHSVIVGFEIMHINTTASIKMLSESNFPKFI